jgi:hypothetical protein
VRSAKLRIEYSNLEKPFELVERFHDLGGTDYYHLARLSEDHARLLNEGGIGWLYGEPKWNEHYRKIELFQAECDKKKLEEKISNLKGK